MDFYDKNLGCIITNTVLETRGLRYYMDLPSCGIYPIVYNYPVYDKYEQRICPAEELVFLSDKYVQNFIVLDLKDEELTQNIEQRNKDNATTRLVQIDEESVRSIRAINAGTATDYDREKLYELETEALTQRQVLSENPLSEEDINKKKIRIWRDILLQDTQWLISRHAEQLEGAIPTSITYEQYQELLVYRQALRDLPQQDGFPWGGDIDVTPFPIKPTFV